MNEMLHLRGFLLVPLKNDKILIYNKASGEAGSFDMSKLEEVIRAFFNKEF